MKKWIWILAALLLAIFVLLVLAPFFLRGPVERAIQRQLSTRYQAEVSFQDLGLNLFSDFPNLTISLNNFLVVNREPFAGDTLLAVEKIQTSVDLWSVLRGEQYRVRKVLLLRPRVRLLRRAGGQANWDIFPPPEEETPRQPKRKPPEASPLALAVENYRIQQARVEYRDQLTRSRVLLENLTHQGSAQFSREHLLLDTRTGITRMDVKLGGIPYLKGARLQWDARLDVHLPQKRITFQDNQLRLNNLVLKWDGFIAAPLEQHLSMDLQFSAPGSQLTELLSLIPAFYSPELKKVSAAGQVRVEGHIKGVYRENRIPGFQVLLQVEKGKLKHPDLPLPVEDIHLLLQIDNPGIDLDRTVVALQELRFRIRQNPFRAKLKITRVVSDPFLEAMFEGKLDLADLPRALPLALQGNWKGLLNADIQLKGALSDLERQQWDRFVARGQLVAKNLHLQHQALPRPVTIPVAELRFAPDQVRLQRFQARMGESDLSASGQLEGLLLFLLKNQPLSGNLNVRSQFLDLNPWLQGPSQEYQAFPLPANVDFVLKARMEKVRWQNLTLNTVIGTLLLGKATLQLRNLRTRLLEGNTIINGSYHAPAGQNPLSDFQLQVNQVSLPAAYQAFMTVQKFAPIARYLQGTFSGNIQLRSPLDQQLTPLWNQVEGKGGLRIPKVKINNFAPLNRLAELTGLERFRDPALQNLNPEFEIRQGRFRLQPLKFQLEGAQMQVAGSNGLQGDLDYTLQASIPARWVEPHLQKALGNLYQEYGKLLLGETVQFQVHFTGTINQPTIRTNFQSAMEQMLERGKQLIFAEIERRKNALADQAAKELEKKKKELENQLKKKLKDLFKP